MSSRALLVAALPLLLVLPATASFGRDRGDEENPHERMRTKKSVCIDCHTRLPKAGEHAPDYFLVDLPSENCLGCHDEYEHAGVAEHAGKEAHPLPGDEKGKIACFTCHDPHPEGVLEGRTVYRVEINERTRALIAARERTASVEAIEPRVMFGALLRFPAVDGQGCVGCHLSRNDAEPWRERLLWSELIRVLPRYW